MSIYDLVLVEFLFSFLQSKLCSMDALSTSVPRTDQQLCVALIVDLLHYQDLFSGFAWPYVDHNHTIAYAKTRQMRVLALTCQLEGMIRMDSVDNGGREIRLKKTLLLELIFHTAV